MLKSKRHGDRLCVYLEGEIDHCIAGGLREEIEALLREPGIRALNLDFSGVSFMDSSGVGMIIGRYKTMVARGGTVSASGLHPPVDRLFHLAGLHRILTIMDGEHGTPAQPTSAGRNTPHE